MGSKQLPWLVSFFIVENVPAIVDSCDKVLGKFFANYSAGIFHFLKLLRGQSRERQVFMEGICGIVGTDCNGF